MTIDQIEPRPTNIHEALSRAKMRIGVIGKDDKNQAQGYAFRGIDSIVNKVGPVFSELGILVVPTTRLVSSEETTSAKGARGYRVVVETLWTFSIQQDGEESLSGYSYIVAQTLGESIDYSDKALNQAQTQSFKNALAQVLTIPTGEVDPDELSPDTAAELEPGEQILEVLIETMSKTDARKYVAQAMKVLGIKNPIPKERIDDIIVHAQELRDDLAEKGEGYGS